MVYDVSIYAKLCKNKLFQITKHFVAPDLFFPEKIHLLHARVLTSVRNSGNNDVEEEDVDRDMDDDRGDDDDDK